jgi:hypothetical protein
MNTQYENFNCKYDAEGRPTEIMVIKYLSYLGYSIEDCKNQMQKQRRGYDIVVNGKIKIEIKKDWKISETGNFLGEWAIERKKFQEAGWMQHTIADWLIYFDGVDTLYLLDMQKFITSLTNYYHLRYYQNVGDKCNIWGYLLNKDKAKQFGILKKTIKLSDDIIQIYKDEHEKAIQSKVTA